MATSAFFGHSGGAADQSGIRRFAGGTHTSRTIMLAELGRLMKLEGADGMSRTDFGSAIIADNALGKSTAATRRLTFTRLGELYTLDQKVPLFRLLQRLWRVDEAGRPLLAMLAALARDPLLLASAPPILALRPGDELGRDALRKALAEASEGRLSEAVLGKVARNVASSWTQSGHLAGRTFKRRQAVEPTPGSATLALWIACHCGFSDTEATTSGWARVLDADKPRIMAAAQEARRLGILNVAVAEDVVSFDFSRLDGFGRR